MIQFCALKKCVRGQATCEVFLPQKKSLQWGPRELLEVIDVYYLVVMVLGYMHMFKLIKLYTLNMHSFLY